MTSRRWDRGRVVAVRGTTGGLTASFLAQWVWVCACLGQEAGDSYPAAGVLREAEGRVLVGRVFVGDRPADTGTVVLHRVSGDSSGEVDSVGVGTGGRFEFVLPASVGTGGAVFFAAIRHQGVLYFGPAISGGRNATGRYDIQAYPAVPADPTTRPTLQVRNIVAVRPESGRGWDVTDFFELRNGASATLVAGGSGSTWSHVLPPGAEELRAGRSDLSAGASLRDGRVQVSAPIPPGESLHLLRYHIPSDDFTLPLEVATGSVELLVREPAGHLAVSGLAAVDGVDLEGVRYRRFAGRDLAPSVVTVNAGSSQAPPVSGSLVAVLLTFALAGAGALLAARQGRMSGGRTGSRRRRVLAGVARLDEERAAGRITREDHESRRIRLLEELRR